MTPKMSGKQGHAYPEMNAKRRRFVEAYLIEPDARQAALKAGYGVRSAGSQGRRLLQNGPVSAAIRAAQEARSADMWLTAQYVLEELKATYEAAKAAGNWAAANKSLELLGKHRGMFRDVTEHTGSLSLLDLVGQASEEPELEEPEEPQIH